MTLGGLWHGAGLTYLAWGVAHGLALGGVVLWQRLGPNMPAALAWLLTFLFVMLTWVLFRASTFEAALGIYQGLVGLAPLGAGFDSALIGVAAVIAILGPTAWAVVATLRPFRQIAVGLGASLAAILLAIGDDTNDSFIYLQF